MPIIKRRRYDITIEADVITEEDIKAERHILMDNVYILASACMKDHGIGWEPSRYIESNYTCPYCGSYIIKHRELPHVLYGGWPYHVYECGVIAATRISWVSSGQNVVSRTILVAVSKPTDMCDAIVSDTSIKEDEI